MTIIAERYEIGDFLGEGGMGRVYRGVDLHFGIPVALKILKPEVMQGNGEQVERFRREAEALYALDHPNIVRVLDTLIHEGQYCIVMEYMAGGSLRDLMKQEKRLSIPFALELSLDLCDALTRTHRLRIIHRDVKPDNVLLSEQGIPHLTDFGYAHISDAETLTRVGQIIGTVQYMAPEILLKEPADPRTDIWGFGVMLYEMISGYRPFMGENASQVIMAILHQPVPDLQKLRPDCPPKLARLVMAMLHKKRDERIFSIREVGAQIEAILGEV